MQIAVNMSQFKVNIGFGSGQAFSFCTNNKTHFFVTRQTLLPTTTTECQREAGCNSNVSCRYPYGQYGPVPAVCYLNLLLPGHESSDSPVWFTVGLPEQHGDLHGLCYGHLPVKKCGLGHYNGSPHWLCVCHTADSSLHTHLPLPQGERGR